MTWKGSELGLGLGLGLFLELYRCNEVRVRVTIRFNSLPKKNSNRKRGTEETKIS
jgi:hypothetical protein